MHFMRFGNEDGATPCVLGSDGKPRDLTSIVPDITPQTIPHLHDRLAGGDIDALPVFDPAGLRIAAPFARPATIWCIGLNYSDHAKEAGMEIPKEPILFTKGAGAFCGPNDDILHSPDMLKLDWEVELGVVIGRRAFMIDEADALDHVLGYCVVNDVSERHWQIERGGTWIKGKSFPHFCPAGPVLVTRDEIADPQALDMWLTVNGETMQQGSTATMVFTVRQIVAYMSRFAALEPGDLICTGTPPGVGMGKVPQRWLVPGDNVALGITGLGKQHQAVRGL